MKNIIFIAPPASGKGTQSELLSDRLGYIHLSAGDMLRDEINAETDLGLRIKNIIDKGDLVSDEIIFSMIKTKLELLKGKPYILDGFPRTLKQAKYLDDVISDNYVVIYLKLDESIAVARMSGRLTCSCGKSYNLNVVELSPKVDDICDNCGRKLTKRNDDNIEAFKVRFTNFIQNTEPVVKYYEDKGKIQEIDVNRSVEDIYEDILKVAND